MPPTSALISLGTQDLCCHGQPGLSKMLNTPKALPGSPGIQISTWCSPGMVGEAAGNSLSASMPSMELGLGVAFEGQVPGVPFSLTGSASHKLLLFGVRQSWNLCSRQKWGHRQQDQARHHLKGTTWKRIYWGHLVLSVSNSLGRAVPMSYCQCGCSLCEASLLTKIFHNATASLIPITDILFHV